MNNIQFLSRPAPWLAGRDEGARRVMDFRIDGVSLEELARRALPAAFEPRKCEGRTGSEPERMASLCGAADGFVLLGGEHFLTGEYRGHSGQQMRLPLLVCASCLSIWCGGGVWTGFRRENGVVWWEGLESAGTAAEPPVSFRFDAAQYDAAFEAAREKALQLALRRYRPAVGIQPACLALFEYTSRFVTPALINDHCMDDPGFSDYVREYMLVLRAGPPASPGFDFWESFGDFTEREADYPEAGRRFACFLFAAALAVSSCPDWEGNDRRCHAEKLTRNLLGYALALGDQALLGLLAQALIEVYPSFASHRDSLDLDYSPDELPFLTLARLALAHEGYAPQEDESALREQLIREAREHEWHNPPEYRWERPAWANLSDWWRGLIVRTLPGEFLRALPGWGDDPPRPVSP